MGRYLKALCHLQKNFSFCFAQCSVCYIKGLLVPVGSFPLGFIWARQNSVCWSAAWDNTVSGWLFVLLKSSYRRSIWDWIWPTSIFCVSFAYGTCTTAGIVIILLSTAFEKEVGWLFSVYIFQFDLHFSQVLGL